MTALALRLFPRVPSLLSLSLALFRLAGIGLFAIGLSGVVALAAGLLSGKSFVSGDLPGVTYTAARCADFLEYFPRSADCAAAATAHHFDEVVSYRLAAGLLGILVLSADRLLIPGSLRRRAPPLTAGIVESAGASTFALAALGLLGIGLAQIAASVAGVGAGGTNGAGAFLSAGLAAAPFAAFYALKLLKVIANGSRPSETA